MKSRTAVGMVLAVVAVAGATLACRGRTQAPAAATSADSIRWEHDLASALKRAGDEKKLVMVDFYTDWCGWCKQFDRTTLADGKVRKALARVVLVKLDAERGGHEAASRYSVEGYPTVLFLSASGNEVGRIPGYMEAGPFLDELGDIFKHG